MRYKRFIGIASVAVLFLVFVCIFMRNNKTRETDKDTHEEVVEVHTESINISISTAENTSFDIENETGKDVMAEKEVPESIDNRDAGYSIKEENAQEQNENTFHAGSSPDNYAEDILLPDEPLDEGAENSGSEAILEEVHKGTKKDTEQLKTDLMSDDVISDIDEEHHFGGDDTVESSSSIQNSNDDGEEDFEALHFGEPDTVY